MRIFSRKKEEEIVPTVKDFSDYITKLIKSC